MENKLPPGIDDKYLVASRHGLDASAIAITHTRGEGLADLEHVRECRDARRHDVSGSAARHRVLVGRSMSDLRGSIAGRWAAILDPDGAPIRLWQPGYRHGAQLVNGPARGTPPISPPPRPDDAEAFYGTIFGWEADPVELGGGDTDGDSFMWRLPGYGDFLAIRDPDIKRRHASRGSLRDSATRSAG